MRSRPDRSLRLFFSRPRHSGQSCRRRQQQQQQHRHYTSVVVSNILPDVSASAACVRTRSLIRGLVRGWKSSSFSVKNSKDIIGNDCQLNLTSDDQRQHQHHHQVIYATSAPFKNKKESIYPDTDRSISDNVHMAHLPMNRSGSFQEFCNDHFGTRNSGSDRPDLVLFDRFYTEEAHSFRFHKEFPESPLVLDMQDFHALRLGRHNIVKQFDRLHSDSMKEDTNHDPFECLPSVMNYYPTLGNTTAKYYNINNQNKLTAREEKHAETAFLRELASIQRSDMTLVCSPFEMELLEHEYHIPKDKLCLAPFFVDSTALSKSLSLSSTRSVATSNSHPVRFIFCGGFRHAPNADAVDILLQHIWPKIRSHDQHPTATLHIYGAFCPSSLKERYNNKSNLTGVYIHGYAPSLSDVFCGISNDEKDDSDNDSSSSSSSSSRTILLAPLRFGAGIKGKIVDAWTFGVPVVTTPLGSEGMVKTTKEGSDIDSNERFAGRVASTVDEFVHEAVCLATNNKLYETTRNEGYDAVHRLFPADRNWNHVEQNLSRLLPNDGSNCTPSALQFRRRQDFSRALLWHESSRSTEYLSRWIECKELRQQK